MASPLACRAEFRHNFRLMSKVDDQQNTEEEKSVDFIREMVAADVAEGKHGQIVTRFPPEPNGYLHLGHAKSICLNFGIALENNGVCNLRMDDTNPTKEDVEYVRSIEDDIAWLIGGWADQVRSPEVLFASNYFERFHDFAVDLIRQGKAFVCDLNAEDFMATRGTPTQAGTNSPYRDRSVDENLDLFKRMREGEFPDGAATLRAKIDMASPNIHLRDPAFYRIRHSHHHRTGDEWCLYPTYDFAHCLEDSIEGITHSLCTLEFEVHRPVYEWILDHLDVPSPQPQQTEFARLNVNYTVLSKRKLLRLVEEGKVDGWDDPRMPTISAYRRRGVPAEALRGFCEIVGVTKFNSTTEVALLEHTIREVLNAKSVRRFGVLRPIKIVITNYPEDGVEDCEGPNHPADPESGTRTMPFAREIYIDQDDFAEVPPPKFFRLKPGGEVRLKFAYIIRCEEVVKDADGGIVELRCTYDDGSKRGGPTADRKVKGTIHWVSAKHAIDAPVHLYERLFNVAEPGANDTDFVDDLNPDSLETVSAKLEPSLADLQPGESCQFERVGYFCHAKESTTDRPVFLRTITMKDAWGRKNPKK
jgi:glutaminyl-tRNA synthetase